MHIYAIMSQNNEYDIRLDAYTKTIESPNL